ncbi:chlorite dismutase, partial [Laceyella sediminis]
YLSVNISNIIHSIAVNATKITYIIYNRFNSKHLRPNIDELNDIKTKFNKLGFAGVTSNPYSYLSVVELSSYTIDPDTDPLSDPAFRERLQPILPKTQYTCFYPTIVPGADQQACHVHRRWPDVRQVSGFADRYQRSEVDHDDLRW